MRLPIAGLLLLAGLLAVALPAQAEEEISAPAGLEARAADLAEQVATLRAAFSDLAARLDALEKALDREESGALDEKPRRRPSTSKTKPKEEAEKTPEEAPSPPPPEQEEAPVDGGEAPADAPDAEPEDGLDPAIRELVGTYTIDMDAFIASMTDFIREQLRAELGDVPDEIVEGAIGAMRSQLETMEFQLVLEGDMTFVVTSTMGGEESSASGTWERDGETVTLHQTQENGEDVDEPLDMEGVWDGTILRIRPDQEIPVELLLTKTE